MDLIFLSKILTYVELFGNAILSVFFVLSSTRTEGLPTDFVPLFGMIYGTLIVILNFLTFGELSGFEGRNLNRKFMIYSIVVRFIWLAYYSGTFCIAEEIDNLIIISISTTSYGLIRLILQIYIAIGFLKESA